MTHGVRSGDVIDVSPEVMRAASEALSAAAGHLLAELRKLDDEVAATFALWQGAAGGSYSEAWRQWQVGAQQVHSALAVIAGWLREGAGMFEANEQASAQELGVHRG